MAKPETMMIDDVKYVREDSVKRSESAVLDGLKYAIVRSRGQGVMAGYVTSIKGQAVTLLHARQLWRWDSKFVLQDLAESGVRTASRCKFSQSSSQETVMLEACGVLFCTKTAADSIQQVAAQNA